MSDAGARRALLAFFFVSGACSLVYQVVWLRLAMARFGVTAPLVSTVIAVFMAGLALGSAAGGRLGRTVAGRISRAVPLYATAEIGIALSGESVPALLDVGRSSLAAADLAWGSAAHHVAAGGFVALALLPFCTLMGATLPLGLAALCRPGVADRERSFSALYLANVLGAAAGTLASAFVLIERFGFRGTLSLAASGNATIAAAALVLALLWKGDAPTAETPAGAAPGVGQETLPAVSSRFALAALFVTGSTSMAMEVVWVRLFTPYLGSVVYAFAAILAIYLLLTFLGTAAYRRTAGTPRGWGTPTVWMAVAVAALLPLLAADPRLPGLDLGPYVLIDKSVAIGALRVVLGIGVFCYLLGYFTPFLVDGYSRSEPQAAGRAYAVNVLGCIVGPLLAGFALIPWLGERGALVALALPVAALAARTPLVAGGRRRLSLAAGVVAALALVIPTRSFESLVPGARILRDGTGTVLAAGSGMRKILLVNGTGMTRLTPITKMMAHLPLAFLETPPRRGLAVCLGMGTTFRSLASWGIDVTAVELVPSVAELFPFFFSDAKALLADPRHKIVVDDGRRFLERTRESFDVIVLDPPPPVEAAGSSLLYSLEFYAAARPRLRPGGILQAWIGWGEPEVQAAYMEAVRHSFPYVRVFVSLEGWGAHILASDRPIPDWSAEALAGRMPETARADMTEWGPGPNAIEQLRRVLDRELDPASFVAAAPGTPPLRDDQPINEYYLIRRLKRRDQQ
jgi:spermidine synthase